MNEIVEQAKQVQMAAFEAVEGVGDLAKNPMIKIIPGADKLPQIVDLLSQASEVLLALAKEVEQLKGGENGGK